MNKKAIKWFYQELPGLVNRNILTQEAAEKIRAYYGEMKTASRNSAGLIICASLGALFIGLGVNLLFAHNWEEFSRFTRAILSFAPLVIGQILALWVLWKRPQSNAWKEATATFLSLMVGASIALISQTYNIPSDTGTFILTWMFLIIPLVYLMQASIPAAIYLIGITAWSGSHCDNPAKAVLFWPLAVVIVPHFIWALRQEIYTLRATILALVMVICATLSASFSLGRALPGFWTIIIPSLYGISYSLGCKKFNKITTNWQRPLRILGALGLFVLAFLFTFRFVWQQLVGDYHSMDSDISNYLGVTAVSTLPDYSITLAIVVTAIMLFYDDIKRKNLTVSLFGALPLLALISYGRPIVFSLIIFNAYLFVVSTSRIMWGIRNNSLAIVNTGMLMLSLLIIARFFDSDINFVLKGLVFILVGSGFLATNVWLMRMMKGGSK